MNIYLYKNIGTYIKNERIKYYPRNLLNYALATYQYSAFEDTTIGLTEGVPVSIRVLASKEDLIENHVDYVRLNKHGKDYYFFIDNIIYKNDEVSILGLTLDVLNTNDFTVSSATMLRAHRNRFEKSGGDNNVLEPILRDKVSNFIFKSKGVTIFDKEIKEVYQDSTGAYHDKTVEFAVGVASLPTPSGKNYGQGYCFFIHKDSSAQLLPYRFKYTVAGVYPDVGVPIKSYGNLPLEASPLKLFTFTPTRSINVIPYFPITPYSAELRPGQEEDEVLMRNIINFTGTLGGSDGVYYHLAYNETPAEDVLGTRIIYTANVNTWLVSFADLYPIYHLNRVNWLDEQSDLEDPNFLQYLNFRIGRRDTYVSINFAYYDDIIPLRYSIMNDLNLTIVLRCLARPHEGASYTNSPYDDEVYFDKPVTLALMTDAYLNYQRANDNNNDTVKAIYSIVNGLAGAFKGFDKGLVKGSMTAMNSATDLSTFFLSQADNKQNLLSMGSNLRSFGNYTTARDNNNFMFYLMHNKYEESEELALKRELARYGYALNSVQEVGPCDFNPTSSSLKEERKHFTYQQMTNVVYSYHTCDSLDELNAITLSLQNGVTFVKIYEEDELYVLYKLVSTETYGNIEVSLL